jgi:hypothetical protein
MAKKDKLSAALRKLMVELGRKGGKARLKKMTAEQRSEIAKKAARERWKKQ